MTDEEKINIIADCVEADPEDISRETELSELENWDSVAVLSVISVISEKFGRFPSAEEILRYKTVGDLMDAFK